VKKSEVKFDFKKKGMKPVVTNEILYFQFTGEDFNTDKLAEFLT
jgi:hypothetical protein